MQEEIGHLPKRTDPLRRRAASDGFFQFGDMPIRNAARSLERFGAEVLPLLSRDLGTSSRETGRPFEFDALAC